MTAYWSDETLAQAEYWPNTDLVREGLRLFEELPQRAPSDLLLATDLHAGNVLRARREPWLVIDPKPFVGDPAYDATQHLLNCVRGCAPIRTRQFAALRTFSAWTANAFACGRSPALPQHHARTGRTTR